MSENKPKSTVVAGANTSATGSGIAATRRGPRYSIMAAAEVTDLRSTMRISARSTDIGSGGCYVDTLNPLPVGSAVGVRILEANRSFEAQGKVVHTQPGMGMGLAFAHVEPDQEAILWKWLAELGGAPEPPSVTPAATIPTESLPQQDERALFCEIVSLLVRKEVLTKAEGDALLAKLKR